ncbi:MAG: hypothetical protein INQ03_21310 [Candidatus Heimdallarchaeota archaeon]|nr:hypothetical protein [Candidatus Heimdallarchaeota archaeon]
MNVKPIKTDNFISDLMEYAQERLDKSILNIKSGEYIIDEDPEHFSLPYGSLVLNYNDEFDGDLDKVDRNNLGNLSKIFNVELFFFMTEIGDHDNNLTGTFLRTLSDIYNRSILNYVAMDFLLNSTDLDWHVLSMPNRIGINPITFINHKITNLAKSSPNCKCLLKLLEAPSQIASINENNDSDVLLQLSATIDYSFIEFCNEIRRYCIMLSIYGKTNTYISNGFMISEEINISPIYAYSEKLDMIFEKREDLKQMRDSFTTKRSQENYFYLVFHSLGNFLKEFPGSFTKKDLQSYYKERQIPSPMKYTHPKSLEQFSSRHARKLINDLLRNLERHEIILPDQLNNPYRRKYYVTEKGLRLVEEINVLYEMQLRVSN